MPPAAPGTYILVLRCTSTVRIGQLGTSGLRPGYYLYVGSAYGLGGLRARIGHHRHRAQRPHWHVDYLRRCTRLESVWYACGAHREHQWAAKVAAMSGGGAGAAGLRQFRGCNQTLPFTGSCQHNSGGGMAKKSAKPRGSRRKILPFEGRENLHVSATLKRMRYSRIPLTLLVPSMTFRRRAKAPATRARIVRLAGNPRLK
jgi:Uri superfamily endonuclease